jgi:hypothetical protein
MKNMLHFMRCYRQKRLAWTEAEVNAETKEKDKEYF